MACDYIFHSQVNIIIIIMVANILSLSTSTKKNHNVYPILQQSQPDMIII